jgi:hypothetical protein
MASFLIYFVVFVVVAAIAIMFIVYRSVNDDNPVLVPMDRALWPRWFEQTCREEDLWASVHGFHRAEVFRFEKITVATWIREDRCCILTAMIAPGVRAHDLVTLLAGRRGLTTTDHMGGMMFPRKDGAYLQGFKANLDELYRHHYEGLDFLAGKQMQAEPLNEPLETVIVRAIREERAHVRTIPLYPLKGIGWYFTRFMRFNKSISQKWRDL